MNIYEHIAVLDVFAILSSHDLVQGPNSRKFPKCLIMISFRYSRAQIMSTAYAPSPFTYDGPWTIGHELI